MCYTGWLESAQVPRLRTSRRCHPSADLSGSDRPSRSRFLPTRCLAAAASCASHALLPTWNPRLVFGNVHKMLVRHAGSPKLPAGSPYWLDYTSYRWFSTEWIWAWNETGMIEEVWTFLFISTCLISISFFRQSDSSCWQMKKLSYRKIATIRLTVTRAGHVFEPVWRTKDSST